MMDFKLQNILIDLSKILVTVRMKVVEVANYAAPIPILFKLLFHMWTPCIVTIILTLWTTLYGDHNLPFL